MNLIKPFFLTMILAPSIATAVPSDRQKQINIESDSANLDNQKGVSIYHGNVVMIQGSTRLTGDTITIYSDKNLQVTKVIAEGERAYYEELLEGNRGKVAAWGETINYNFNSEHIELLSQAELSQNGDIFKGEKIDYNLKLQTVNATGQPIKKGSKGGRVQMVIQPTKSTVGG